MDESKLITFDIYRRQHARSYASSPRNQASLETVLRFWKENKEQYLTRMFGDELILTKKFVYDQPRADLVEKAKDLLDENQEFYDLYCEKLREALDCPADIRLWIRPDGVPEDTYWNYCDLVSFLRVDALVDNKISLTKTPIILNLHGTRIALQTGMKTMKALSKICEALGISHEFEKFRLAQSMLTNQRRITGQLHLSIHPMDFATASDNANGWSSCMSWEDEGCYRMGTVEMMNSPMVLCAYVSSDKVSMDIAYQHKWNSKKWRAWVVIHPQFIFVNRHYPYHSDEIATEVLKWVKELAAEKLNLHYGPIIPNLVAYWNEQTNENDDWRDNIIISTNYMYNDVGGDDILGCMSTVISPKDKNFNYSVNISGPAECLYCGRNISFNEGIDPATLVCPECGCNYCAYCNEPLDGDDYYTTPDGDTICPACYESEFEQCHCCGEVIPKADTNYVIVPFNRKNRWWDKYAWATLCPHCTEKLLDKGWILNFEYADDFVFDTEELNEMWHKGCQQFKEYHCWYDNKDMYILNPDPHIQYTDDDWQEIFGRYIDTEYCCSNTYWNCFGEQVFTKDWQQHLISPLYNTEEEEE